MHTPLDVRHAQINVRDVAVECGALDTRRRHTLLATRRQKPQGRRWRQNNGRIRWLRCRLPPMAANAAAPTATPAALTGLYMPAVLRSLMRRRRDKAAPMHARATRNARQQLGSLQYVAECARRRTAIRNAHVNGRAATGGGAYSLVKRTPTRK